MVKNDKGTKLSFDDIAQSYSELRPQVSGIIIKWIIDRLKLKKGMVAVDIGCGTGHLLLQLRKYFKKLIGIDPSFKMLAECKKDLQKTDNFELINGKGENLPIADRSINVIIYCRSIQHMDIVAVLKEAKRVGRNDAQIVIISENRKKEEYTAAKFSPMIKKLREDSHKKYPTKEKIKRVSKDLLLRIAEYNVFSLEESFTIKDYIQYHLDRPFSYSFSVPEDFWKKVILDLEPILGRSLEKGIVKDMFFYDCYILRPL